LESWRLPIAGEIWLKSAGLTSRLELAFLRLFLQVPGELIGVAQKFAKINE